MSGFFVEVFDFLYTIGNEIIAVIKNIRLFDVLDILIIAFVIYKGIELIRETRAQQLLKGIIVLFVVWLLAQWLDMKSLKWLMVKVVDSAIIAIAIIFQPELRRALEHVGRSNFGSLALGQSAEELREVWLRCIDSICRACQTMQEQKIGALIVIERATLLGEIIDTGTVVDAAASASLISNIFFPKSPLHDGAMIIRAGKVYAAGCILPLTSHTELSRELGTRHRAAIGMSENSDAIVVVVSEETGIISVAENGKLTRDYNTITLRERLKDSLIQDLDDNGGKRKRLIRHHKKS
ncbi:MAG TPA: TIGR00159 family protein [Clostridiales bacterium]|nr:TIGR00159 family protein [Clostridiales bacterium]